MGNSFLGLIASVVFIFSFLTTLLLFEVWILAYLILGIKDISKPYAYLNLAILKLLKILGTKVKLPKYFSTETDKDYLIISNHQSMFDIPLIYSALPQLKLRFIAKKELSRFIPGISKCLRFTGSAIIDRNKAKSAIDEIKDFAHRCKENDYNAAIFPEGTRSRTGKLGKFKSRGFLAFVETNPEVLIVPIVINGSWKLTLEKNGSSIWGNSVELEVGEICKVDSENPMETFGEIESWISSKLV